MGSSGGSFESISPADYKRYSDLAKDKTKDTAFETQVSEVISDLLSDYNNKDNEAINSHLDKIRSILENEFGGIIELKFGGSVKKRTYVDGLSDIDVLILINKCDLSDLSPNAVLNKVKGRLQEMKLRDIKEIRAGDLAVTVTFNDDKEIQLLPAISSGEGYKIAKAKKNEWSRLINPDKFADRLTKINQSNGGKVIPVIKLMKGINDQFPEPQKLNGYHIESMAIEIFKSYPDSNPRTPKAMLKYFFEKGKDILRSPIRDKTGQSRNVDDYLGQENSENRLKISRTFDIIFRRMRDADEVGDVSMWKEILGA